MKKIKEIFNVPEKLTDSYNIVFLLYVIFGFFVSVMIGTSIDYWTGYSIPLIYAIYFFYIKTLKGKYRFNKANKVISYINIVIIILCTLYFLYHLFYIYSFYTLVHLLSYIISLSIAFYWIIVFFLKKEKNKIFMKTEKSNQNIFFLISFNLISLNILSYITYIIDYGNMPYLILNIVSSIFVVLLYIMVLRYIYLYQEHKKKGEEENV